jgi:hypothetical protein
MSTLFSQELTKEPLLQNDEPKVIRQITDNSDIGETSGALLLHHPLDSVRVADCCCFTQDAWSANKYLSNP